MDTLLDRFCRYVQIDTQADDRTTNYPSSPGQFVLGKLLVDELRELGLADAAQDEWGIVTATLPGTVPGAPTIAWMAHLDTSPETSGKDVKPQVVPNYDGRDLVLPGDPTKVLRPADSHDLLSCIGHTLVTTDGTTLLGADNKSGVAVIMEAVKRLLAEPHRKRGPIKVLFTCDEEIGRGADHVDPSTLGAVVGYTLDGAGVAEVEGENFSADKATVTVRGVNIHPSVAKGKMVNAIRLAGLFLDRLPRQTLSPETTHQREGFLHPYVIEGGVAQVTVQILLRDFVTDKLADYAELLRGIARGIETEFPGAVIAVAITKQYRNMADGMSHEPRAVAFAVEAVKRTGLTPKFPHLRGGTDGALLTAKGLPTPNLSTAEHNMHSPLEWTSVDEMRRAVDVLVELAGVWAEAKS